MTDVWWRPQTAEPNWERIRSPFRSADCLVYPFRRRWALEHPARFDWSGRHLLFTELLRTYDPPLPPARCQLAPISNREAARFVWEARRVYPICFWSLQAAPRRLVGALPARREPVWLFGRIG